jgi:hypothetical protein
VEKPFLSAVRCDVKQTEINTAEPLVTEPSVFEVEMAIEKLKNCLRSGRS